MDPHIELQADRSFDIFFDLYPRLFQQFIVLCILNSPLAQAFIQTLTYYAAQLELYDSNNTNNA